MFGTANRIAYDNQMVQARKTFPLVRSPLAESCWFHVNGQHADTQLVEEELACLRKLLLRFLEEWPEVETQGNSLRRTSQLC